MAKRATDSSKSAAANGEGTPLAEQDGKDVKDETGSNPGNPTSATSANGSMPPPGSAQPSGPRQPWELVEEVMNVLKTAFPLLALTMEKMVDQISLRAKPSSDEDIYRFFAALLADALQVRLQTSCEIMS
jgi:transformation/transcription domain-associated protein